MSDEYLIRNLCDVSNLTYQNGIIINPFTEKNNRIIFADDTASGRPCPLIDSLISKNINPYYSNTHSNATCGTYMKNMIYKTREIIKYEHNLNSEYKIFFCGNGCTGAINLLVNKIDLSKYKKIIIHTTPFEHHSNYLPWLELINRHGCKKNRIKYIDYDDNFDLHVDKYIDKIQNKMKKHTLNIFALTACSNVTGKCYIKQYKKLYRYISDQKNTNKIYLFMDFACIAPYIDFREFNQKYNKNNVFDGYYFSGHKFLGGPTSPGILIVKNNVFDINVPYQPGGGCVITANDQIVEFKHDIEALEMCGTPNIIGIIRFGYLLTIKRAIIDIIHKNEHTITKYINCKFKRMMKKYPSFYVIGLSSKSSYDLPIYAFIIKNLHYNLITVLLNDLFGIQTRGGFSCSGTLGRICQSEYNINGWCRISFNYLMTYEQIIKIIYAIKFIIKYGHELKKYYKYDESQNMFHFDM